MHGAQQVAEGGRIARHLQPHVEALLHAEAGHDVVEFFARHVHGARRAHLLRQAEPVVIDVRDDHVARADVLRNGDGHDADRAGAGDEHVLAHHVEGEGGVRGIAKGIQDAGDVVGDRIGQLERIARGDDQVFGEATLPVDAHAHGVAAQVATAGATIATVTAGDVAFARDPIAHREPTHFAAHVDDAAEVLVPNGHGHGNGLLRPGIPVVDVHVGAADGGLGDLDEHVVRTDLRDVDVPHPDAGFRLAFYKCFHGLGLHLISSSSRPTLMKAASARSSCASFRPADICVRMRASPFGTTGNENPTT